MNSMYVKYANISQIVTILIHARVTIVKELI